MASDLIRNAARRLVRHVRELLRTLPIPHRLRRVLKREAILFFDTNIDSATGTLPFLTASGGRAIGFADPAESPLPSPLAARVVAFYLPQFHPIPENDNWWGKGFTEWSNVARAKPQFEGQAQPKIPADLGYYDLRVPSAMGQQVALARQYGIEAFCFYFYWFNGKRMLEAPVERYLNDQSLDLPYCLCWANESWTRRWDGREEDVLIPQHHSPEDDLAFIECVARHMRDARYLRVNTRPVLLVYRTSLLPEPKATALRWREYCRQRGIGEIHLISVQSFDRADPSGMGFDASVEFPPNLGDVMPVEPEPIRLNPRYRGQILDWREMAAQFQARPAPKRTHYRAVNPAWDNEARRPGNGRSFIHSAPRRYEDWLRWAVDDTVGRENDPERRLIFINAWNEWAEGAHLEPDTRLGHAWLNATKRALAPPSTVDRPCVVAHVHHLEFLDELLTYLGLAEFNHRLVITTSPAKKEAIRNILLKRGVRADLHVYENRGRDVLPFLKTCNRLLDEGEDIVLKVHSKKSLHIVEGDAWRKNMLDELLEPNTSARIRAAFAARPELGMTGPASHWLDATTHIGGNAEIMELLSRRMGTQPFSRGNHGFFAGTMFWVRLRALRPLLDASLEEEEFCVDQEPIDGTLAHAIERILSAVVLEANYQISLSNDPGSVSLPPPKSEYNFLPK